MCIEEDTYIVNGVSGVSAQGEYFVTKEGRKVACETLKYGHDDGSCDEADPFLVDESEGTRTKTPNPTRGYAHREQERGEC